MGLKKKMKTFLYLSLLISSFVYFLSLNTDFDGISLWNSGEYKICHYGTLWCKCLSAGGGCEMGCKTSFVKSVSNTTYCPPLKGLILMGFEN